MNEQLIQAASQGNGAASVSISWLLTRSGATPIDPFALCLEEGGEGANAHSTTRDTMQSVRNRWGGQPGSLVPAETPAQSCVPVGRGDAGWECPGMDWTARAFFPLPPTPIQGGAGTIGSPGCPQDQLR